MARPSFAGKPSGAGRPAARPKPARDGVKSGDSPSTPKPPETPKPPKAPHTNRGRSAEAHAMVAARKAGTWRGGGLGRRGSTTPTNAASSAKKPVTMHPETPEERAKRLRAKKARA